MLLKRVEAYLWYVCAFVCVSVYLRYVKSLLPCPMPSPTNTSAFTGYIYS